MVIFHSHVSLPEGNYDSNIPRGEGRTNLIKSASVVRFVRWPRRQQMWDITHGWQQQQQQQQQQRRRRPPPPPPQQQHINIGC